MTVIGYLLWCSILFSATAIVIGIYYLWCDREVDIHDKTMRLREARKLYEEKEK